MSNQTFDFQRFSRYAQATFSEKKRGYFWHFAVSGMIYCLILLMIFLNGKYPTDAQYAFYYTGLLVTGSVFAVRYFSPLAKDGSALVLLMQPVSTFEKWLLSVLTVLLFYPLVYTLVFELMTLPMTWVSKQYVLNSGYHDIGDLPRYQLFIPLTNIDYSSYRNIHGIEQVPFFCVYIGTCAFAVTASIFFKRLPLIKSLALGFGLFLLFLFIMQVANVLRGNNADVLLFWFDTQKHYQGDGLAWLSSSLLWIIAPWSMWLASFFALKERDLA